MDFSVKRIYEAPSPADGQRVLVDRLWPRGVSKEHAALTEWCKDIAPSNDLRKWFGHQPARFEVFAERYRSELATDPEKQADLKRLQAMAKQGPVTLLYGAKDTEHNQAVVLRDYLERPETGG